MDMTGSHEVNSDPTMADAILDCLLRKARGPPSPRSARNRCAAERAPVARTRPHLSTNGTRMSYMKNAADKRMMTI